MLFVIGRVPSEEPSISLSTLLVGHEVHPVYVPWGETRPRKWRSPQAKDSAAARNHADS
jgi:hypothetical protein